MKGSGITEKNMPQSVKFTVKFLDSTSLEVSEVKLDLEKETKQSADE